MYKHSSEHLSMTLIHLLLFVCLLYAYFKSISVMYTLKTESLYYILYYSLYTIVTGYQNKRLYNIFLFL